jgi:hypothetical protein
VSHLALHVPRQRALGPSGALAAALLAITAAACGPAATPSPALNDGLPPSPVDGIVLSVDSSGLSQVHGFRLRTASGAILQFTLGTLENPTQFPPGHIAEHQANAAPVRVYFVPGPGGGLVVYRLEDAPGASPTA